MKILNIVYLLFKRSINNKTSLIIYMIVPIVGLLFPLLGHNNSNIENKVNIAMVDLDKSNISEDILKVLEEKYKFNIYCLEYSSAKKQLIDNKVLVMVVIPENFKNQLIEKKAPNIELSYLKESEDSSWLRQIINTYIVNLNILSNTARGDIEIFNRLYNEFKEDNLYIRVNILDNNENAQNMTYSTLGFIMLFMIMMVSNSFSLIINDRNKSTYERVLRTSTSNTQYIMGHVIWNGLLCLIQSVFFIGVIKVLNINIGFNIYNFFIVLLLIYAVSISIGILIISLCKTEEQVTLINTLIVFPSCMLSGCLWPLEIMGSGFQKLSYIFPQRYIFIIMKQMQNSIDNDKIIINIVLILLICTLIFVIGIFNIERVGLKELT